MQTENTSKESALLDGLRRLTEHSPVMALPRLILTQHLHNSLIQTRKRLRDSHKHLHNLMGENVGDEEDGGISVAGDTINYHVGGGWLKPLATMALGAAIPAAAAAGYWWWTKPTPPAPTPPAAIQLPDYQLRLEVKDTP